MTLHSDQISKRFTLHYESGDKWLCRKVEAMHLFGTSNFIGSEYHAALLFLHLGSTVLLFVPLLF